MREPKHRCWNQACRAALDPDDPEVELAVKTVDTSTMNPAGAKSYTRSDPEYFQREHVPYDWDIIPPPSSWDPPEAEPPEAA